MMHTMCAIFIDFVCGLGVYSFKMEREELWGKWGITCISADTALGIMQDTDLFDKK